VSERPAQVTVAGVAVVVAAVAMVLTVFATSARLEGAIRVLAMVEAACAVAAGILGWYVLRRSTSARIGLTVVAGPLLLAGLVTTPLFAIVVEAGVIGLWLPAANKWFVPPEPGRIRVMSDVPPPSPYPYGAPTPPPYPYVPVGGAPYEPDDRPGTVLTAAIITFVLSGLTALLGLLCLIVAATVADDLLKAVHDQGYDTSGFTSHDLAVGFGAIGVIAMALSIGAIVAAAFVLRRSQAARVILTVLSGVTIAASLLTITSVVSIVTLGGAIAVIVLLFVQRSNRWFARHSGV
jgi:hypothetical protein